MTELHELNAIARKFLEEEFPKDIRDLRQYETRDIALLLIANFLREISDKSHEISEHLNLISSTLQGIEMNTRPKP